MPPQKINKFIKDLAKSEHLMEDTLVREAFRALLREKRRVIRVDQLEIMKRYGVSKIEDLDDKIREGLIAESPAWEDRIALDNLDEAIKRIDHALAAL